MKLPRRNFLHLAAGAAALPAASRFARAQAYPTKPVRIIFGLASGSAGDILARLIGQWLSERLGQPFVIENRVGAGGSRPVFHDEWLTKAFRKPLAVQSTVHIHCRSCGS